MNKVQHHEEQDDFSFKKLFVPLTTFKAIHIIVIVGFIVFANMLFNGFVWDDKIYIIHNPEVHSIDFFNLIGKNFFNNDGQYRPIPALYFATAYSLFKDVSFFYHFIQLVLHIVNTSLIFILFKRFVNKKFSLFLSLIFLIHPIQVESVSYIAASVNTLFLSFGLTALVLSFKNKLSKRRIIAICGLLLLSFLTKETGLLFFLIILFYRVIFNRDKKLSFIAFGLSTIVFYFILRITIGEIYLTERELAPIARLTLLERFINIPAIIFYYIRTFFFPSQLAIFQEWTITQLEFSSFYMPLFWDLLFFVFLYLIGIILLKREKNAFKNFSFFFIWFLLGLGLHLQIFPLDMTVADRWFYFPMVGLLGVIGVGIEKLITNKKGINALTIFFIIIIIILSVRTIIRNTDWVDAKTLFIHDSIIHTNHNIENNLGAEYGSIHDYENALKHYKKSVEFFPMDVNLYNVGYIYEKMGNIKKAKEYYLKSIDAKIYVKKDGQRASVPYERLGWILTTTDDPRSAKRFIKSALQDYPTNAGLWMSLAISEYKLDNQKEALYAAGKARSLLSNDEIEYLYDQISNNRPIEINNK